MNPYHEAHLFVAAIRVIHHKKHSPPTIEELCSAIDVSVESGLATCRTLAKLGIIELSEDPFSIKLGIGDHLAIEKLPRETKKEDGLSRDLEAFMAKKKDMDKKLEAIQADLKKKRQDMHGGIEEKLRKEMEKLKKGG